jgi:hypothetical protein
MLLRGLLVVIPAALSLGLAQEAIALDTRSCGGLGHWGNAPGYNSCAAGVTMYLHICYGLNGRYGSSNVTIPYGQDHYQSVQQWSTYSAGCGGSPSSRCPGTWYIPLQSCEGGLVPKELRPQRKALGAPKVL